MEEINALATDLRDRANWRLLQAALDKVRSPCDDDDVDDSDHKQGEELEEAVDDVTIFAMVATPTDDH
jgi:hypothetical protein